MKKFRQLSEQLDVSSEHGPQAGRFASGSPKKVVRTQPLVTPKSREEVPMESVVPVEEVVGTHVKQDMTTLDSKAFKQKHGKSKSEAGKYVSEARMSAAVKLQRAFEREQQKSAASKERAKELLQPKKPEPVKEEIMSEQKPPFDGPYKKTPEVVTDKSGAKHGPMSRVRDLARDAMKKVSTKKKKLNESRKAEIVKQASKDAKKKSKEKDKEIATDKFQSEPTLDSQVIKTD